MPNIKGTSINSNQVAVPTSYKLDYINLVNHNGDTRDIQALVTDFSITESIYMPGLMFSMNVKDPVNFMEEFQLSGQERIDVKVVRARGFQSTEEDKIDLSFYVTEYPVFAKFSNYVQVYSIKGISEHVYHSKFKRVSRAWKSSAKNLVHSILSDDLGYAPEWIYVSEKGMMDVPLIVPNLAPIDAIAWILRRSFDEDGSPWYCYESLEGGMNIVPQSELVRGDIWRTFKEGKFFTAEPFTAQDYQERQERILTVASNLRMSKYIAGANGAYSSKSVYVDIGKKRVGEWRFNYLDDYDEMTWLNPDKNNLDPDFGFNGKSLATMHDASINYIPTNSMAYQNGKNYHSGTSDGRINRAQSYLENMDNVTHELKVAGDFGLSAGKVVDLRLMKSIDPSVAVKNTRYSTPSGRFDESLSGRHLITSVIHNFGEEYFCDLKVKKDSVTVQYYA